MKLDDRIYTILKYCCQVALPALGTFYFALAQIWNLPYSEQIVGTIAAITTLIGVLLGISSYNFYKEKENANS